MHALLWEGEHAFADLASVLALSSHEIAKTRTSSTCACVTVGLNSKRTMCMIGIVALSGLAWSQVRDPATRAYLGYFLGVSRMGVPLLPPLHLSPFRVCSSNEVEVAEL